MHIRDPQMHMQCVLIRFWSLDPEPVKEADKDNYCFRHDKFAPARELLTLFNIELARHVQVGPYLVQDETLYPFRQCCGAGTKNQGFRSRS